MANVLINTPRSESGELKIVQDATCTFCGCVCDDIDLTVKDNHIIEAKRACVLGKAWFLNHHIDDRPSCLIKGQPASLEEGYELAAELLTSAKYPIVYGLSDSPCEAQRVAVSIVDWISGTIDTTTSVCHGPSGMAFQGVGEVTCSLGEVANRGDLIMFWGSNPAESHPRHFTKYSLMPKGMFLPNGRKDRTCVIVDVRRTKSAKAADIFIQIKPRSDFEALWTLRALAKGVELDAARRAQANRRRAGRVAGPHGADEGGQVRRDLLRHGPHDDPRQALQQRGPARADARHERLHALRGQAQPRARQRHRRRQRRRLADWLSIRRESRPRLSRDSIRANTRPPTRLPAARPIAR